MTSVHHFGMTVRDLDETKAFYGKYFDFKGSEDDPTIIDDWFAEGVATEGAQVRLGWLNRDDAVIELHQYVQPRLDNVLGAKITDIGAPHIAFRVEDLDAMCDRLEGGGVPFYSRPVEVTKDGSVPELAGVRWVYCVDPNGYIV